MIPVNPTFYVSEFLNIYLIDVVSGSVVFSVSHKRAREPVHMVHSENWLLYSYFSEKSRRTEIVTLELYEGKVQSNTTGKISNIMFQLSAHLFIRFLVICWTFWNEISSHFYNFNKQWRQKGWAMAQGLAPVGVSHASHLCMYVLELPFLLILLPQFALYMYFYLRPTTMKKELRKFLIKACGE
jgi:hypothetical protein